MVHSKLECHKDKLFYQMYKEILCPSNKIIDENKFDLAIYTVTIRYMFGTRCSEQIQELMDMQNKYFHMKDVSICSVDFERLWSDAWKTLERHSCEMKLLSFLKTSNLFSVEDCKGIYKLVSFL